ncbi:hypothetical protein AAMO2058_001262900 [Amorphochlora amoebiformis]
MQSDAGITRWSIMVEIEAKDRRLHIASNSSLHNLSITTSRGNTVVYTSGILLPKALSNHPEHMIALCDGQPFLFFPDSPEKTKIKIRTYDGTWHPSRVIKRGTPVSLPGGRGGTLAVLMVEILPGGGREMEWVRTSELRRGMNLLTVSSPFGAIAHETFVNTLSSGIISTILSNGLVVSDARCFPGSQGGAVLTRDGRFIGIIARSFQNTMSAEKGTMTLVVTHQHLSPFLQPHATLPEPKSFSLTPRRLSEPSQAIVSRPSQGNFSESSRGIFSENSGGKFWDNSGGKLLESQVMLMTVGSSWATCFPISCCGYFLTNRHTFDTYLTKHLTLSKMVRARIRITSQQIEPKSCSCRGSTCILPNRWFEPHLVYTPRAGFDLAVLKVDLSAGVNLKCKLRLRRAFESPAHLSLNQKLGTSVRVVGYGIFSPMESQSPMITQGVLSKTFYKPPLENPKVLSVLSLSLFLSFYHSLSFLFSLSLSLFLFSLFLSCSLSLFLSFYHSLSFLFSLSFSLFLSLSFFPLLSLSFSLSITLFLSSSLSLFLSFYSLSFFPVLSLSLSFLISISLSISLFPSLSFHISLSLLSISLCFPSQSEPT